MSEAPLPHSFYITAAYGFAALVLAALTLHTLHLRRRSKKIKRDS